MRLVQISMCLYLGPLITDSSQIKSSIVAFLFSNGSILKLLPLLGNLGKLLED